MAVPHCGIVFHNCCHLRSAIIFISFRISLSVCGRAGCESWTATAFSFAIPSTTLFPVLPECSQTKASSIWHMSFADTNSLIVSSTSLLVGFREKMDYTVEQTVSLSTVSPLSLLVCGDSRSAITARLVWLSPLLERRMCLRGHHHPHQSRHPLDSPKRCSRCQLNFNSTAGRTWIESPQGGGNEIEIKGLGTQPCSW